MHGERAEYDGAGRHDQAEQEHGDGARRAFQGGCGDVAAVALAADGLDQAAATALAPRQPDPVQRQADDQIDGSEDQQRLAPAHGSVQRVADRPEDAGGEAAEQRQVGDGTPPARGRHLHERGERGVVQAQAHGDAEQAPKPRDRRRGA